MSKIDISKIKPGDEVELGGRFKVTHKNRKTMGIETDGSSWVTAHYPAKREFKVGDMVMNGEGDKGVIRAIDGDQLWVKFDKIGNYTTEIRFFTHID